MKLIDVLLSLFDSFSIKIEGLLGVGTITNVISSEGTVNDVIWYIYFVTPETNNDVSVLINNSLILCKRDINLFINSPCKLYEDTTVFVSNKLIEELMSEVYYFSNQYNSFCSDSYITHMCKYLEFNMELN